MTKLFNEIAENPAGWLAAGLISCMVAHAIMIPTGLEQWLHTTFSVPATPEIAQGVDQILDLSQ